MSVAPTPTPPLVIERDPSAVPAVRVLVLARVPAVRAGLGALLTTDASITLAGNTALGPNWPDASRRPGEITSQVDVVVADLGRGDLGTDDLFDQFASVPLVLLGGDPAQHPSAPGQPIAWLAPDADGPSLIAAVHAVAAGLTVIEPSLVGHLSGRTGPVPDPAASDTLTPREREVLELVAEGLPNKTIAHQLGISEHTAKFHVGSLLTKLDAGSRTEAVTTATRRGLLTM